MPEFVLEDVVLALSFPEADQLEALALEESVDRLEEGLGHGERLFGRGEAVAQIAAAEGGDAGLAGELGDVGIEVHPVDAFQFQDDVILLELGRLWVSFMASSGWAFVLEHGDTAACRQYSGVPFCGRPRCPTGLIVPEPGRGRGRGPGHPLTRQGLVRNSRSAQMIGTMF